MSIYHFVNIIQKGHIRHFGNIRHSEYIRHLGHIRQIYHVNMQRIKKNKEHLIMWKGKIFKGLMLTYFLHFSGKSQIVIF